MVSTGLRPFLIAAIAGSLVGGVAQGLTATPGRAATTATGIAWTTVVNNGALAPGSSKHFNSYNQPSVNRAGLVTFRARTQGNQQPERGIYARDMAVATSSVTALASVGDAVPQPNNSGGTFNEFPAFPRIDTAGTMIASRGQSTPVWTYQLNGTDTKVGTSGIYATTDGTLSTGASLLGAVPGFEGDSVPGAPIGTRFDQFPGSPAVDGTTIVFKGNYTDNGVSKTGVYYRTLAPAGPIGLIANASTRIPNQPAGGTTTFGSTAPPSAADGRTVFTGWDDELSPTLGGIYLADTASSPTLQTLAGIGDQVPGEPLGQTFTNFGEGLSFDGRYVAFWGSWGSDTQSITLTCPTDGNADLLAYCRETYPNGYTTSVPVHQGVFVHDTVTGRTYPVVASGEQFSTFQYWVFSGRPPGTGGSDEVTLEPARWRVSAFVAVTEDGPDAFQVAFKASSTAGGSGIYLAQGPGSTQPPVSAVETGMPARSVDEQAPAGAAVTSVGLERDGFRGRWLAVTASMLDPVTSESWAGVYLSQVPQRLTAQTITVLSAPPTDATVGGTYQLSATADSGLPVEFSLDATTTNAACSINDATVNFDHAGTCVINFDQPGDATHLAAPRVQQSFAISVVPVTMSLVLPVSPSVYGQPSYALAVVSAATGTAAGEVQFAVDGTPLGSAVPVSNGRARSATLRDSQGQALPVGAHRVIAAFTPLDPTAQAPAGAAAIHVVNPAATTMALTVRSTSIVATVRAVAPGIGTPTGTVTFSLGGVTIGSAALRGGIATLAYVVPSGKTQQVAASFRGDARFTGSSASTSRSDPTITAKVTSRFAKSRYGWYRAPVTVTFRCVTNGAALVTRCPARVILARSGAAQSLTRTIVATNGGAATVVIRNINIDRVRPTARVSGVRNGAVYYGTAPTARCIGRDTLSGVATCRIGFSRRGERTTYRATVTDKAGNVRTLTGSYRTLKIYLQGTRYVAGAFQIAVGRTYTLVVHSVRRPVFYDAQTYPGRPVIRDQAMHPAGHHRWALGVTMTSGLRNHPDWNLGVRIGMTMHLVRIHVR